MRCISHDQAITQAKANAKYCEEAFDVFLDQSNVWNCERSSKTRPGQYETYFPNGTMERRSNPR